MNKEYIAVLFSDVKGDDADMLMAMLGEIGFEGFEEADDLLKAYISKEEWNEKSVEAITEPFSLSYRWEEVPAQNWNVVWESHFEPVVIDDFVAVRADFHEPISGVQYEIVITPKMSFGTGHHATTTMMIQQMRNLDFSNKSVFDFGTGTGILSVLAEKLGAAVILAIDNDEWSIENGRENKERNGCERIIIELRNDADINGLFDVILANINRNIILDNFSFLSSQLKEKGCLLVSGLLWEDEEIIRKEAGRYGLTHINTVHRQQWISLLFGR